MPNGYTCGLFDVNAKCFASLGQTDAYGPTPSANIDDDDKASPDAERSKAVEEKKQRVGGRRRIEGVLLDAEVAGRWPEDEILRAHRSVDPVFRAGRSWRSLVTGHWSRVTVGH